jgi:hypothetical protein
MSLQTELRRGEQARQLQQNELYNEAFDTVRQAIIDKWIQCPVRDREGQHELKLMLKLLGEVTGFVDQVLQTGKMAEIQLQNERQMEKLKAAGL